MSPTLKHYDGLGTVRFITFSTYKRQPTLLDNRLCRILLSEIENARNKYKLLLLAYVIMPEHVHLVLLPPNDVELGRVIGQIKSLTARRYFAMLDGGLCGKPRILWQKRCYDHNCRNMETVREKIRNCHRNPVKRGLAKSPEEYEWSSFRYYLGKRDVALAIDII